MLTCASCGAENPAASKFCHECGTSLARSCTACGAVLSAAQRFCGECGTLQAAAPASASPSASASEPMVLAQAERRVCSVLFVDLVGFTPLSESRDAEDIRELLSQYFDRARTIVERYGGVVEKFIGDAVMAIWGTPVAVEGDAERAVRAGLDLVVSVAELGELVGAPGLRARAGVVTGDVAVTVGAIGEGVAGDTINTAARVQTAASPGTVWVDDVTERITHAAIGYVDAGEHVLKGKAEAMHLWTATRVLSTVGGVQRVDGLEAPMLGRDVDLRAVKDLLHASIERRQARLVVVSGPAGIGKSRLGWEFEKYVDGLADEVLWHRGRCLSYGEGVAFWALASAVRQRLAIAEEDPAEVGAAKLAEGLEKYLAEPGERAYVGSRLARLLGLPYAQGDTDAALTLPREELFAGWRLFLERLAARKPVILLVEDAQHADTGLLEFLDHLIDWSRDVPIFVLVFGRPELTERQPGWGIGRNRSTIALDTLDDAAMDTLVDRLVPGMPPATRAAVAAQAQGVPLYAVETIRSLIDRDIVVPRDGVYRLVGDVSEFAVPDTLRGLLAARFDALPPQLHALLSDAAVLGSNFPDEALAAISGRDVERVRPQLAELVRREILDVSADPLSPQRGFYGFSQNLLRQVVYDTLSRRDRKSRHVAVATHLRSVYANDGEEVIEVVAQHYVDALAAAPDDPDSAPIRQEAIGALIRGAERARQAGAPRRAAAGLATAAGLVGEAEPRGAAELWMQAAAAGSVGGQHTAALDYAATAADVLEQLGDVRAAANARVLAAVERGLMGERLEAAPQLAAACQVLAEPADRDTVFALSHLARSYYFLGDQGKAESPARTALRLAQDLGVDRELMSQVCDTRGLVLESTNRYEEGVALLEHSLRLAEQGGKGSASDIRANALVNLSNTLLTSDPARARTLAMQCVELGRRFGKYTAVTSGMCNAAAADLWVGRWDAAGQLLAEAEQDGVSDDVGILQTRAMLAGLRGDVEVLDALPGLPTVTAKDLQDAIYAAAIEAMATTAAGEFARTVTAARIGMRMSESFNLRSECFAWCWTLGLRAARELDDEEAAARFVEVLEARPAGAWPRLLVAEGALARAVANASIEDAGEAVAALREVSSPYHLAHGLLDLAALVIDTDPSAASACVREAGGINAELRAPALTRRLQAINADANA